MIVARWRQTRVVNTVCKQLGIFVENRNPTLSNERIQINVEHVFITEEHALHFIGFRDFLCTYATTNGFLSAPH